MHASQHQHIATVMRVAVDGVGAAAAVRHEQVIRDSWLRCVQEHRLDPTRMQEAVILPQARLREHQDQMEAFLQIARHGLESLYQQVAGMGYVVLLTDARGVTVDFLGDLVVEPSLRRAGLYLGADWSEHHAGTCGVGTCLVEREIITCHQAEHFDATHIGLTCTSAPLFTPDGQLLAVLDVSALQALTVHLDDHFDATHIPLTCTAAPVFDATGRLSAVLDISMLSSAQPKSSQHLALQLVKVYAQHVENAQFLQRFRQDWVLRLSVAPQFLEVNPDFLLAVDAGGRLIGHNRRAQLLLQEQPALRGRPLIGQPLQALLEVRPEELGRFMAARPADQRAVMLVGGERLLFMLATPPPVAPRTPVAAPRAAGSEPERRSLPAPLAALSGGDARLDRQIERAARLVNSPVSLLVTGETGSGKEYFAKALHAASARHARPFVAVNCAAIPEGLIESELFGHLPGAFTGAGPRAKLGLIQAAHGGTLFLDEIGDMPRSLQARLLRVLAEREVLPVGASQPVAVDIRVIAATHCPLETLVREGRFRDDLYYRLNGAHFQLPPLRERSDLDVVIDRLLDGMALDAQARALLRDPLRRPARCAAGRRRRVGASDAPLREGQANRPRPC